MNDFEIELRLNEKAYASRGTSALDEDVKFLKRYNNKVAIRSVKFFSEPAEISTKTITDLEFLLVAHPHPECTFEWLRLVVNVDQWPEAEITDMLPRSEKGDQPTKYTISDKKGLSIEATSVKLGPSYTRKNTEEHTVYFEKITVSGKGGTKALWDFRQQPNTRLQLENLIKLVTIHDSTQLLPSASVSIEAYLKVNGWVGNIPLIGSRIVTIQ